MKDNEVRIYDVFAGFRDSDEEPAHIAVTKNSEKAEALVKAIEDCGSEAYVLGRTVSASLKWVQEITE